MPPTKYTMPPIPQFAVVLWIRKTDTFSFIQKELLDLVGNDPDESTEYQGSVDFHWRFENRDDAMKLIEALKEFSKKSEVVILRLSNYGDVVQSITFKDDRHPSTKQALSDAEFDRLSGILERFGDKRAMNIEQIDGFLTALICGPSEVSPNEYLPSIWGGNVVIEDAFSAQPILQDFLTLIERHRDTISHTLQSDDVFLPLLLENEHGIACGNDWASGFMRGMELRREDWAPLLDDEERGGSIVPILTLAHEHDPDPEMRPYKGPISEKLRETLIVGAAAGVTMIYRYFRRERLRETYAFDDNPTYRRIAPKVGRNEPCPCGSGKKFKHCCGQITLH